MRFRVLTVAALLAASTQIAPAAEPWNATETQRERAVMFYFSKSFGTDARGRQSPLMYGLRLQQSSPFPSAARVDLFDLNLEGGPRAQLLNGALQLDFFGRKNQDGKTSSQRSSDDPTASSDEESSEQNRPQIITWSIIGLVGAACAFEWGICKSGRSRETSETPTPTPGPG